MNAQGIFRYPGVLIGGFISLTILSIMNSSYSYVLDSVKQDLNLTYTQSGALMSAYFVGYAFGQIPWGLLADRFGSQRVMSVSIFGVSIATVLFGFADGFWTAAIARFLSGLLGAGVFVPAVRLIAGWYEKKERGTALGLLNIGGSIGLFIVTWASPLLAIANGWRLSIMIQGAVGMSLAFLVFYSLKNEKRTRNNSVKEITVVLRERNFWILAFVQFIRLGSYYTFLAWLPLLLKEDYNFDVLLVGTTMSLFNLAGMISNPVGGILADRVGERTVLIGSFLLLAVNVYTFTMLPVGTSLLIASFLLGWFINFVRSPAFTIIPRLFGAETAGSLSGLHNTFASLGALTLPLMLGVVKDATLRYNIGWLALSSLIFTGSILLAFVKEPSD